MTTLETRIQLPSPITKDRMRTFFLKTADEPFIARQNFEFTGVLRYEKPEKCATALFVEVKMVWSDEERGLFNRVVREQNIRTFFVHSDSFLFKEITIVDCSEIVRKDQPPKKPEQGV